MHGLGQSFGDAVSKGFHEDGAVIVIGAFKALGNADFFRACGDDESAQVIGDALRARKSERQRFGLPSRFCNCWRRPWKVASVSLRLSPV